MNVKVLLFPDFEIANATYSNALYKQNPNLFPIG